MSEQAKMLILMWVFLLALAVVCMSPMIVREVMVSELTTLKSECIRLGYGYRDANGDFVLKEKAE